MLINVAILHQHEHFMREALKLAHIALKKGEVPVGSVIVRQGKIIGRGYNSPISSHNPCAHAEINAIKKACQKQQNYRLPNAVLYSTLEPCLMCFGAIQHARIAHIVFGAPDTKLGVIRHSTHHIPYTQDVLLEHCHAVLKDFFLSKR